MQLKPRALLLLACLACAFAQPNLWFGISWYQLPPQGPNPPGRLNPACAWDPVLSQLLCHGGSTGPIGDFSELRDTWRWDGVSGFWQLADVSSLPLAPNRNVGTTGATFTYLNGNYYLFGGQDSYSIFNTLWQYSTNGTWTLLNPAGSAPTGRFSHTAITRTANGATTMVIFGGSSLTTPMNDIWSFDGVAWTNIVPSTATIPPGMFRHAAAYDSATDTMWVSGGVYDTNSVLANTASNTVWKFDLNATTWTAFTLSTPLLSRVDAMSVFYSGKLYQYGGAVWPTLDVSDAMYSFDPVTPPLQWNAVAVSPAIRARAGMSSIYLSTGLSFIGSSSAGMLMFGGYSTQIGTGSTAATAGWQHNSLHWLDLSAMSFTEIKQTQFYPEPRKYHSAVMVGTTMYLFGGLNERLETLGDMWSCLMTPDASLSTSTISVAWTPTQVASAQVPSPRSKHAAVASVGLIYVFGGLGVSVQSGRRVYLSDFWAFNPLFSTWTQIIAPGAPDARFGHTLTLVGASSIYMYGGTTADGITNELWMFSPETNSWTHIVPLLPDSLWPKPVTAHAASEFIVVADGATAFIYQKYAASIQNALPASIDKKVFSNAVAAAAQVQQDTDLRYLFIYGGYTNLTSSVVADIWMFDLITSTWSAPLTYSPSTTSTSFRRYSTMFASADSVFIQGGGLYNLMSSQEVGYLQIRPYTANSSVSNIYSYPWTNWGVTGTSNVNTIYAVPSQVSVTQLWTLSPVTYQYIGPASVNDFSAQSSVAQTRASLSGVAGNSLTLWSNLTSSDSRLRRMGHSLVRMADSMFLFGGSMPSTASITPSVNFATASSTLLMLQSTPVCNGRVPSTQLSSFPTGFRQTAGSSQTRCITCDRGSFFRAADSKCVLCGPGTYSAVPGTADQCTQCPAGFYYKGYGATSLQMCSACPSGTYQSNPGSSSCTACPAGKSCPVLTTVPFTSWSGGSTTPVSVQPPALPNSDSRVTNAYILLGIVLAASYFTVLVVSMYMYHNGKLRHQLRKLDVFFFSEHDECTKPVDPTVEEWRQLLITQWQTELGGIWSMFFFLIGCSFISFFLIPYLLGNVTEKRSLVPLLSEDPVIQAMTNSTFTVSLQLTGYAQSCELAGRPTGSQACDPGIQLQNMNTWSLSTGSSSLSCTYTTLTPTRDAICQVDWTCSSCKLAPTGSVISLLFNQQFSLAKSIWWSISSTSGVGGEFSADNQNLPSSASAAMYPSNSDLLFRGYTPNVVSIVATPSTFRSELSYQPLATGYLLQYQSSTLGSQQYAQNVAYWRGLAFSFNMTINTNEFTIIRSNITSLVSFLAQLVGALSGLLTVYSHLLTFVERLFFSRADSKEAQEARERQLKGILSTNLSAGPAPKAVNAAITLEVEMTSVEPASASPTAVVVDVSKPPPPMARRQSTAMTKAENTTPYARAGTVSAPLPATLQPGEPKPLDSTRAPSLEIGAAKYPKVSVQPSPAMLRAKSSYRPPRTNDD